MSQLWGNLSSAPELNTVAHWYIPFPARGAAVALHLQTCGWVLSPAAENSSLCTTQGPKPSCAPGWGMAVSWVPLCGGCRESTAPRDGAAPCRQLPKLGMEGSSSWWRTWLRRLLHKHQRSTGWDTRDEPSPHPHVPLLPESPIPVGAFSSQVRDWEPQGRTPRVLQGPVGPVTSEMGLRRSSQPTAAQDTHGKRRKRNGTRLPSAFSLKNLMNSRLTPWEWDPTGAFINQVISRQLVVFFNLGLILSHQFKLKPPIG